ncbi:UNKNOWN [Stylonychia lemnae]|uniref:Cyclic nucleotide-binding domain-containing protein n=1 Tax=Stylonychia lemnae TaxID=5949 RepID=A0A077ZR47_STYLE|nr:UNKNOWN [Stylonychia lemnae]|eukprot:CDW72388.1 UNKNOWN [Stylonychia lemnae]
MSQLNPILEDKTAAEEYSNLVNILRGNISYDQVDKVAGKRSNISLSSIQQESSQNINQKENANKSELIEVQAILDRAKLNLLTQKESKSRNGRIQNKESKIQLPLQSQLLPQQSYPTIETYQNEENLPQSKHIPNLSPTKLEVIAPQLTESPEKKQTIPQFKPIKLRDLEYQPSAGAGAFFRRIFCMSNKSKKNENKTTDQKNQITNLKLKQFGRTRSKPQVFSQQVIYEKDRKISNASIPRLSGRQSEQTEKTVQHQKQKIQKIQELDEIENSFIYSVFDLKQEEEKISDCNFFERTLQTQDRSKIAQSKEVPIRSHSKLSSVMTQNPKIDKDIEIAPQTRFKDKKEVKNRESIYEDKKRIQLVEQKAYATLKQESHVINLRILDNKAEIRDREKTDEFSNIFQNSGLQMIQNTPRTGRELREQVINKRQQNRMNFEALLQEINEPLLKSVRGHQRNHTNINVLPNINTPLQNQFKASRNVEAYQVPHKKNKSFLVQAENQIFMNNQKQEQNSKRLTAMNQHRYDNQEPKSSPNSSLSKQNFVTSPNQDQKIQIQKKDSDDSELNNALDKYTRDLQSPGLSNRSTLITNQSNAESKGELEGKLKKLFNATYQQYVRQGGIVVFDMALLNLVQTHPILNKISGPTSKMILENACELQQYKKGSIIYTIGETKQSIYIPVYGQIKIWNQTQELLGKANITQTFGEECICDSTFQNRIDNCSALTECGVICIDKYLYQNLKNEFTKDLFKQFNMLESIFRRNFFSKKHWRTGSKIQKIRFGKKDLDITPNTIENIISNIKTNQLSPLTVKNIKNSGIQFKF